MTFLFHGIFRDPSEVDLDLVAPQQRITVAHFRAFVEQLLERGYQFVAPTDVPDELSANGKYVLATFDDGYFNNVHVLPVLEEFQVPAVFFISTGHVARGRCFWWDVLYREGRRRGASPKQISHEGRRLMCLTHDQIEAALIDHFGEPAFEPVGDVDRPLTPTELADFCRSPYVHLGNHTRDHAILTNYPLFDVHAQLNDAQDDLERLAGVRPRIVSYPNGNYSPEVLSLARQLGFTCGITVERRANPLPLVRGDDCLRLGRHVLWGNRDIARQLDELLTEPWWGGIWNRYLRGRAA